MSKHDGWHASVPIWGFPHGPQPTPAAKFGIGVNFVLEGPFDAIQLNRRESFTIPAGDRKLACCSERC